MITPDWSLSVGRMVEAGATAHWHCHHCDACGRADLPAIVEAKGPAFSLWDVLCRCRACGGVVSFGAAYRAGNWVFPLLTDAGQAALMAVMDQMWWEKRDGAYCRASVPTAGSATE